MKKIIFLSFATFLFNVISYAQNTVGSSSVHGIVRDDGNQKVVDAATISLYNFKDSSLVKVSLADQDGQFGFENLAAGDYFLTASSIGTYGVTGNIFRLASGQNYDAGTLILKERITSLSEVKVEVKKPFIERKIDRTVVNVDASITNTGTSALEVLEKSPGVSVDKDGNVSLKGKAGVMVMLDGRQTYLSGQDLANLLRNMPSSNIDQIEIMTNPSAKYDAKGNSGLINIKTKKIKTKGLNGNFTSSISYSKYFRNNNSVNTNYKTGRFNLFANATNSVNRGESTMYLVRKFRNTSTKEVETIFDQTTPMKRSNTYENLKVGMDFYANKKTTLGMVVSGYLNPGKETSLSQTNLNNSNNVTDSIVTANNIDKRKSNNISTNFNLRHTFDSTGKEFTIDLDYLNYFSTRNQFLQNNFLNPDFSIRRDPTLLIGNLPSQVNIYAVKTDFIFPLKNSAKIETGVKGSYVTTDNNALYQINTAGGYETDLGKTNHFIYKENINAAYVNYSRQIKKWGVQAGLRAENTNSEGHQVGSGARPDSVFVKHYTNLFPTGFVTYQLNDKNTFSLNYGRRIDRPDYEDLNPFYYFLDEYTYEVGNTLLQPQITDNIELSHTYRGFLTTTLNYSKTNNAFVDVLRQVTAERKTFQTKDNLASKSNLGLAVSANFPVASFWNMNVYGNLNYDEFKGVLNGGMLDATTTNFFGNISNQFKFKKGWSAELSGFYRTGGLEGQIITFPMWRMDGGIAKQVLKKKGSLKLSVRDIFKSQQFNGGVKYQDIDLKIKNVRDSRSISLTFSYRFGKPMQQQRRKAGGAQEEQNRVKSGGN